MKKIILGVTILVTPTIYANNINISKEQDYWSMEKILNTTHNTQPFQAVAIYGNIYDIDFSYTKSTEDKIKDNTSYKKIFWEIPIFNFEFSNIRAFTDTKSYKSLLQLDKDFIFSTNNGNTELKNSGTKLIQTVTINEYGFNWKSNDYIDGGLLFDKGYINTKVSYKEYERPFNLSSNKIENVTFKTGVVAFQLIEKKPENGYGFYNNGISFGFGFWSDLERGGEKLSNSLEKKPKVDYFEVSLEPRFIYFIKKDFMLDIGYLFKSTKFGISSFGDTQQLQSQDTIHKINFVLGYKF